MNTDQTLNRFFSILGGILGVLAALASLLLRSWLPLAAVGIVMLCVMALTLSEAAIFAPLLLLVMRAGDRKKKEAAAAAKTTKDQKSGRL